ncbi:MAG: DUF2868 domain-containing protein [Phycisphaeraceae bacterium]
MDASGTERPTLAALVELAAQLDRDDGLPPAQRRQRDRAIGRQFEALADRPVTQALGWLHARRTEGDLDTTAGRWVHGAAVVIVLLGLLLGAGVAAGVFYYDGTRPVNVIHVLAVFVFLQLLTVILTLLAALPAGVTRWLPGIRALQRTLWLISPGRIGKVLARWLPQRYRAQVDELLGHAHRHGALYRDVQQWAILTWSQSFAVAFNVAALAMALSLIAFSDLAFGWSTTLRVEAAALGNVVHALALPWHAVWPEAVPSVELIERSRYFRPARVDPALAPLLGQWWPFLVMCMAVYGLLPRVVLLAVALHQRRRAVVAAIRYHPAVRDLLRRMNEPTVETRHTDEVAQGETPSNGATVASDWPRADGPVCVIDWAQVPVDDELLTRQLGAAPQGKLEAGGARSVEEDAQAIERAAEVVREAGMVVMLVRAWEPPMAEVTDFLVQLRGKLPHGRPIVVVPIGAEQPAPRQANLDQWRRRLGALGDPWLHVAPVETGNGAEANR